jgi:uncharacterized protein (DUF1330 family)
MSAPKELNADFVRSLSDEGPVVMVNLVRFRPKSADGDGTGWDAYLRYSKMTMPLIKDVGGTVLWAGDAEGFSYGDYPGGCWNYVVLVRYPSRAAFLEMVESEAYAKANNHRDNGVDDHLIVATRQTYSK